MIIENSIFSQAYMVLFFVLLIAPTTFSAQEIWTGEKITFVKPALADHTLSANQDSLTAEVCIVRGERSSLYNIFKEEEASDAISPAGTEWAIGKAENWKDLEFVPHRSMVKQCGNRLLMLNRDLTLHLVKEDIYLDIKFLSGERGADGGSYSYERSTKSKLP